MDKQSATALLKKAVGDEEIEFRPGQWEAIDALCNQKKKLLVVERTGWGKSSVYFISTSILREQGAGPTIIVSPLLALMRNQIEMADRLDIQAATINSTNADEWADVKERILNNQIDALLISPERLANDEFVETVLLPVAERIGLLVVDEAHCVSDWGHDFRPDYRRLTNILNRMPPNMPILGTTATANNRVIQDVREQLGDIGVQRGTLVRESLYLQTIRLRSQTERLAWLAQYIPNLPGTGIVYCLTKRDATRVAEWLSSNGVNARAYFSDVTDDRFEDSNSYRLHLEDLLLGNEIKVLVATTALGMGYDKPDLGFVIHYQAPGSIVGYYQQIGRAGRGIDKAYCILLSGSEDQNINEFFRESAFPEESQVNEILEALENADGMKVSELEQQLNMRRGHLDKVLKLLSVENPAPVIKQGAHWHRTPVKFQMDHEKIDFLTRQREMEWQEVQSYIAANTCLMAFLQGALDDPQSQACGRCAVCVGRAVVPTDIDRQKAIHAAQFLRQSDIPFKPKIQVANGSFPTYEWRGNFPVSLRASEGAHTLPLGRCGLGWFCER